MAQQNGVINYSIPAGQQVVLMANLLYNDDSRKPAAGVPLVWTSSDHTVADFQRVNYENTHITVRARKAGSATLTVTDGTHTATIALTVTAVTAPAVVNIVVEAGLQVPIQSLPGTQLAP